MVSRLAVAASAALLLAPGVQPPASAQIALDILKDADGDPFVFRTPVGVVAANDGSGALYIVEQPGRIQVVQNGQKQEFLDITDDVEFGGEQGLLGLAFHPDYASNGFFFVYHTASGGAANVIARYHASGGVGESGSRRLILSITHNFAGNHNGGPIQFGPDGYLYAGVGDGGGGGDPQNNGQSKTTLLGKILRIDVDDDTPNDLPFYDIPADNPFANDGDADTRGEIWAFGIRNPWRITFDRQTGDLFIGDVGQDMFEEVDFQPASSDGGENYGWDKMEGNHCYNLAQCTAAMVRPILTYPHSGDQPCFSITGGYRYRGTDVPGLGGVYLYADFCGGQIRGGTHQGGGTWLGSLLLDTDLLISSFGEDEDGELYVAHRGDEDTATGAVYRVVADFKTLTVTVDGPGTVTSDPAGIDCVGNDTDDEVCPFDYPRGTRVDLTPVPAPGGFAFAGWSGACSGFGACRVTMNADRAVTARFVPAPTLSFEAAAYSVTEGGPMLKVAVVRGGEAAVPVGVRYATADDTATAGQDYTLKSGLLSFAAGQVRKTVTIPIKNDSLDEPAQTFTVALSDPTGGVLAAPDVAVVTIEDNDVGGTVAFARATYGAHEFVPKATITVRRTGGSASGVVVPWSLSNGTATAGEDYVAASGSVTFGAGQMQRTFTVSLINDKVDEPIDAETVNLALGTPVGGAVLGAQATATLSIYDNDHGGTVQFQLASFSVGESAGVATIRVTRSAGTAQDATVAYAVSDGTAVAPGDYQAGAGTVTFAAGQRVATFEVVVQPDGDAEGYEAVSLALGTPGGGATLGPRAQAVLSIVDDDGSVVSFDRAAYSVGEGLARATVTVKRTGSMAGTVTVQYRTADDSATAGSDYGARSGTLSFGPGATTKVFTVPIVRDADDEPDESLDLILENPTGTAVGAQQGQATLTILDNDG